MDKIWRHDRTGVIVSPHAYDEYFKEKQIMDKIDSRIERLARMGYILDSSYVKSAISELVHEIEKQIESKALTVLAVNSRYTEVPITVNNQNWGYVLTHKGRGYGWHGEQTIDFGLWDKSDFGFVGNPCIWKKGRVTFNNLQMPEIAKMVGVFAQKYADSSGNKYDRTIAVLKALGFKEIKSTDCGIV